MFKSIMIYDENYKNGILFPSDKIFENNKRIEYINFFNRDYFDFFYKVLFYDVKNLNFDYFDFRDYCSNNEILKSINNKRSEFIIIYLNDKKERDLKFIIDNIDYQYKKIIFIGYDKNISILDVFYVDHYFDKMENFYRHLKKYFFEDRYFYSFINVFCKSTFLNIEVFLDDLEEQENLLLYCLQNKNNNKNLRFDSDDFFSYLKTSFFLKAFKNKTKSFCISEINILSLISYYCLFNDKKEIICCELTNEYNKKSLIYEELLILLKSHNIDIKIDELIFLFSKSNFLMEETKKNIFYINNISSLSFFSYKYVLKNKEENLNKIIDYCFKNNILISKYEEMLYLLLFIKDGFENPDDTFNKIFYNEKNEIKKLIQLTPYNFLYIKNMFSNQKFSSEIIKNLRKQSLFDKKWIEKNINNNPFSSFPYEVTENDNISYLNFKKNNFNNFVFFEKFLTMEEINFILNKIFFINSCSSYDLYNSIIHSDFFKILEEIKNNINYNPIKKFECIYLYYFENISYKNILDIPFLYQKNNYFELFDHKAIKRSFNVFKKNKKNFNYFNIALDFIEKEYCISNKRFFECNFDFIKRGKNPYGKPKSENIISDNLKYLFIELFGVRVSREEETENNRRMDFTVSTENNPSDYFIIEAKLFSNRELFLKPFDNIEKQLVQYLLNENKKNGIYLIYNFDDSILDTTNKNNKKKYNSVIRDIKINIEDINKRYDLNIILKELKFKI